MSAQNRQQPNRQQLVAKLQKALRATYKPVEVDAKRPLLEQVLYACCLENAPYDLAAKSFRRLGEAYFDLNEVRVTTVAELAEVLHDLPDPARAALALRRVLQGVFESTYSFSLDNAKKHSIAHGIKTLEGIHGIPPFVVSFIGSTALGGHFIPVDLGAMQGLFLTGIISQEDYDAGRSPGLERFVAKKAGPEFGSLLHQFGVDVLGNLHGGTVRKVLQAVNPDAKRLPKRGEPMPLPVPPPPPTGKEALKAAEAARTAAEEHRPAGPQAAARPAGKTPLPPPGSGPKRAPDGTPVPGSKPGPKPFVVKPNVGRPITIKPEMALPAPEPPPARGAEAAKKPADKPAAKAPVVKPPDRPAAKPERPAAKAPPKPSRDAAAAPKAGAAKPPAKPTAAGKATPRPSKPKGAKPAPGKPAAAGRHAESLSRRKPR
jgi:endonuclease-3